MEEIARAKTHDKLKIIPITVKELLNKRKQSKLK